MRATINPSGAPCTGTRPAVFTSQRGPGSSPRRLTLNTGDRRLPSGPRLLVASSVAPEWQPRLARPEREQATAFRSSPVAVEGRSAYAARGTLERPLLSSSPTLEQSESSWLDRPEAVGPPRTCPTDRIRFCRGAQRAWGRLAGMPRRARRALSGPRRLGRRTEDVHCPRSWRVPRSAQCEFLPQLRDMTRRGRIGGLPVTAEVAGSSPVAPAFVTPSFPVDVVGMDRAFHKAVK
jgi:hypothetical protein